MANQNIIIHINPKRILIGLLGITGILVGLSIYGQKIRFFGVADIRGAWHEFWLDHLMNSFYLDKEANIPTFFNALLLFIPSQLFALISVWKFSIRDKYRYFWAGLALLYLFLAFDEASSLHETLIKPMRAIVGAEGIFRFSWVVAGGAAVILFGLVYFYFFLHLERKFKILFFISLAVYIGGVVGGEMISGYVASNFGMKSFIYGVTASLEESLELIGCSLLIYSLLEYLKDNLPQGLILKSS
jgi:hypothetical protein